MRISTFLLVFLVLLSSCNTGTVSGDQTIWSKLSIDFVGPETSERAHPNPFTDYRLDVEFTSPSGEIFKVPGFYAASVNTAETSDSIGNIWRVNFTPGEVGDWKYKASFVSGKHIAAQLIGGESAGYFDGTKGKFTVTEVKHPQLDFRNKGKLEYVGEHYMKFRGNQEYFLKAGANSPEVLLEYKEFDNTPSNRTYPTHINDWQQGDPTWQGVKGKGIVGAINYLSSLGLNSYYFLSMNAYGDGKKAWPWLHQDSIFRYDVSKLAQWDILFQHMNAKGILVNMILTETENEAYFEELELGSAEGFADSRKIYFREMVARFGYLNAISYSIGEENGWDDKRKYQKANSDEQRKQFADYLRELCYYEDFIGVHNGPSWDKHIFPALYGHKSYSGPSFQWDFGKNIYDEILSLRLKSDSAKHKWVVNFDEPYVDPQMRDVDEWRKDNVWPTFMAGGAGIELYIGKGLDVTEQDFYPYEQHYKTMVVAKEFFKKHVPFYAMQPDTAFCTNALTLRKKDELFVLYASQNVPLELPLPVGSYSLTWYNPLTGEHAGKEEKIEINQEGIVTIEAPVKIKNQDFVVIIKHQ